MPIKFSLYDNDAPMWRILREAVLIKKREPDRDDRALVFWVSMVDGGVIQCRPLSFISRNDRSFTVSSASRRLIKHRTVHPLNTMMVVHNTES